MGHFPVHMAAIYDAHCIFIYATLLYVISHFKRIYIHILCTLEVSDYRGNCKHVFQIVIASAYLYLRND